MLTSLLQGANENLLLRVAFFCAPRRCSPVIQVLWPLSKVNELLNRAGSLRYARDGYVKTTEPETWRSEEPAWLRGRTGAQMGMLPPQIPLHLREAPSFFVRRTKNVLTSLSLSVE